MSNKKHVYYEGNDVTFRGAFEIDNVAQTPDAGSVRVKVMEKGYSVPYVSETNASISGTQLYYKVANLIKGTYRLLFTATYGSGADKRTGIIDFVVRTKEGR